MCVDLAGIKNPISLSQVELRGNLKSSQLEGQIEKLDALTCNLPKGKGLIVRSQTNNGTRSVWVLLGWATEQMLRSLRYEKSEGRGQELLPHLIGILYPPFVLRLGRQRLHHN